MNEMYAKVTFKTSKQNNTCSLNFNAVVGQDMISQCPNWNWFAK